jgi:hypothetical protein
MMSEVVRQAGLQNDTRQLLDGPLKHVRAAALAAALVPLASVVATPASAQDLCGSAGTVCGIVFNDANKNGIQDAGEGGIEGVTVLLSDGTDTLTAETGPNGIFSFFVPDGTYTITVKIPTGYQASPPDAGSDDTLDSDGVPDGKGSSIASGVIVVGGNHTDTDFGFFSAPVANPGTGTPGYWKNHPEAWPVSTIKVGGVDYTKDQAIAWLSKVGKDKTVTMFSSLVPAMLNVMIGNDASCIASTIADANAWLATYGLGTNVPASSAAWAAGEPLHIQMDNYNNGRLCAPHRQ